MEKKDKDDSSRHQLKAKPTQNMKKHDRYDPFMNPPSLKIAKTYGKAFRVKRMKKLRTKKAQKQFFERRCIVSGLDPEAEPLAICGSVSELTFLGSGFILLFSFIKFVIFLTIILAGISILKLKRNVDGKGCLTDIPTRLLSESRFMEDEIVLCNKDWITFWSAANYGLEIDTEARNLYGLYVIAILLVVGYMNAYVKHQHELLDSKNDVPDDFTLAVHGLPKNESTDVIKDKFEKYGVGSRSKVNIKVHTITLAYQMKEIVSIQKELGKLKKKLLVQLSKETKGMNKDDEIDEKKLSSNYKNIQAEVKKVSEKLLAEEKKLLENKSGTTSKGIAYITFNSKLMYKKVLKFWGAKRQHILFRSCDKSSKRKYTVEEVVGGKKVRKNVKIWVETAPPPSEIMWANLGLDAKLLIKRRIMTFLFSGVILAVCFGFVLGLKVIQKQMRDSLEDKEDKFSTNSFKFRAVSFAISMVILMINTILAKALRKLTIYEKYETITDMNRSLILKVVIAQFINSCILICFVHMILVKPNFQIWAKGAVLSDAMFILIADLYIGPVMTLINPFYILKLWKRKRLESTLKNKKTTNMTQAEANKIFEGRQLDPAYSYAKMVKIFLQTVFFIPILPVSPFIGLVALLIFYWSYKYRLIRRVARPASLRYEITTTCIYLLRLSPFVLGLSYMIFDLMIRSKVDGVSMGIFGFGVAFAIIPLQAPIEWILNCCCYSSKKVEQNMTTDYDQLRHKFLTEYERINPVTQRLGVMNFAKFLKARVEKRKKAGVTKEQMDQEVIDNFNMQMQVGFNVPTYDYGLSSGGGMNIFSGSGGGGGYGSSFGGGNFGGYGGGYGSYGNSFGGGYGMMGGYQGMSGFGGGGGYNNYQQSNFVDPYQMLGGIQYSAPMMMNNNTGPVPQGGGPSFGLHNLGGPVPSGPTPAGPTPSGPTPIHNPQVQISTSALAHPKHGGPTPGMGNSNMIQGPTPPGMGHVNQGPVPTPNYNQAGQNFNQPQQYQSGYQQVQQPGYGQQGQQGYQQPGYGQQGQQQGYGGQYYG